MANNFHEIITKLENPSGRHTNQGEVYIALPECYEKLSFCPLVIALHGSGREALSYRDVPFYAKQRDIALKCGFVFASVSNGPDTYGLDDGYENVIKLYEHMIKEYKVHSQIALWASSAGGLMMHRLYRQKRDTIKLLLGIFPVFDPQTMPPLKSMLKAFGAKDKNGLEKAAAFLSPGKFPRDTYSKAKIVIAHGKDDSAVPLDQSLKLYKQVKESGGEMMLIQKPGGHSTENFALYDTPAFEQALTGLKSRLVNRSPK